MQIAAETAMSRSLHGAAHSDSSVSIPQSSFSAYKLIRRDGAVTSFGRARISVAVPKTLPAEEGRAGRRVGAYPPTGAGATDGHFRRDSTGLHRRAGVRAARAVTTDGTDRIGVSPVWCEIQSAGARPGG